MPVATLPAGSSSPRIARAFVASWLDAWGFEELEERALLATSEMVSNAVNHAGPPVELEVDVRQRRLRIAVSDPEPTAPRRVEGPLGGSGRGLHILDRITDDWGVDHHRGNGKTVWCLLDPCPAV